MRVNSKRCLLLPQPIMLWLKRDSSWFPETDLKTAAGALMMAKVLVRDTQVLGLCNDDDLNFCKNIGTNGEMVAGTGVTCVSSVTLLAFSPRAQPNLENRVWIAVFVSGSRFGRDCPDP